MEVALVGLLGVVLGAAVSHILGARRERDAERRAWRRAYISDAIGAVAVLLDLSKVDPFGVGIWGSDADAVSAFEALANHFDQCVVHIRPLMLFPDESVKASAEAALGALRPAYARAHTLRFQSGVWSTEEVREAWDAMASAAESLAQEVRRVAAA